MIYKFTLEDVILKDSLEAVSQYQKSSPRNQFVIVGGIANQLYTYSVFPALSRPTTDLDIDSDNYINFATFRDDVASVISKSLQRYSPKTSDKHHIFQIEVKDEDATPLLIHSYKFSVNAYERNKKSLERQVANAHWVNIPNFDSQVLVVRPEEVLYAKLDRLRKVDKGNRIPEELKEMYERIRERDWIPLADEDLKQWLVNLIREKQMLPGAYDEGELEFKKKLDHYRSSKDIYDVSLLITLALQEKLNIDESYYQEILKSEGIYT
ncbi:hypothetical protein HYX18_00020 [Candidatus Woesearchaeota archaeon]|nr:hypothetical protein [Candidatus Woesearchaeota archaeon]